MGLRREYRGVKISTAGEFQLRNAGTALLAVEIASRRGKFGIDERAIRKGFATIQENSGLCARLSVIERNPLLIADVAHNPDAVQMLVHALRHLGLDRLVVVFGVLKDKNFRAMVISLSQIVARAIVVAPATERARSARELEIEFRRRRVPTINAGSVREGVKLAKSLRLPYPILVTGSNFVVGEALAHLTGKNYLTISQ
jgi:dihydrofolate synthase/folylpolyglutamate synthase